MELISAYEFCLFSVVSSVTKILVIGRFYMFIYRGCELSDVSLLRRMHNVEVLTLR